MNHAAIEIIEEIGTVRESLLRSLRNLTQDRYNYRPDPLAWSVGEVVHHLYLFEKQVTSLLEKQNERARKRSMPPARPELPTQLQCLDGFSVEVPTVRVKAPEYVVPTYGMAREELERSLEESRKSLMGAASDLCEFDLSEMYFPHPYLGKINMYQWLLLVGKHEQRHTLQIEATKENWR